jgi:hypothetical protein
LEHWFAAESEVAGRPATTLRRPNDPPETLPATGRTDQKELARNGRNEEPKGTKTSDAAELGPSMSESSASCLQQKVNTPPGLPLMRPLSDS